MRLLFDGVGEVGCDESGMKLPLSYRRFLCDGSGWVYNTDMETPATPGSYQSAQQTPPPTMTPMKPETSKRTLWISLAVIALLTGAAYAWTQRNSTSSDVQITPSLSAAHDVAAGWTTYTNNQYGFEFKHPASWLVQTSNGQVLFTSPETKAVTDANTIVCNDGNDATPCNPEIVAVDVVFQAKSDDVAPNTEKTIMLNGITFTQYEAVSLYGEKHYKTTHGGATLDFTAYDRPILNQILSTFRFTN